MSDENEIFAPGGPTDPDARERALEGTLDAVWSNACEDCGRPLHPRATACDGCALDATRSGA